MEPAGNIMHSVIMPHSVMEREAGGRSVAQRASLPTVPLSRGIAAGEAQCWPADHQRAVCRRSAAIDSPLATMPHDLLQPRHTSRSAPQTASRQLAVLSRDAFPQPSPHTTSSVSEAADLCPVSDRRE